MASLVDEDDIAGKFSDDEDVHDISLRVDDMNQKLLLNGDAPKSEVDAAKDRKALCWSIAAMAMSIPALIGA
jgi:hypothetical protein